jgi:ADP-heptose:LPS heptosyltransferase
MALYQNKKIDIILPWRIGDSVLNIPMLSCLKQLNEKFADNNTYRIVAKPFLTKLHSPVGIFETIELTTKTRLFSNIMPADVAFFTETINTNWGYTAKIKYGRTNPYKKIIKYHKEMPFLLPNSFHEYFPQELVEFLREKHKFSQYASCLFGIVLEMGYTSEQIIQNFEFSHEKIALDNFIGYENKLLNGKYVVFCMEAAYGKKGDANRRWNENYYLEIAEKCHKEYNLNSVFVGVNQEFAIPKKRHLIDLRKQVNLFELAQILKNAEFYIGNDTAPLHISNIMKTPSVACYFMKHSFPEFSPMFPEINTQVYCPQSPEEMYDVFKVRYEQGL